MAKNLLSDTDYTSGRDNRYKASVHIAYVTKIECDKAKGRAHVRVIIPDKVDHKGNPLITKPVPVMQVASQAKKSFAIPRVGDCVLLNKMPNGTSDYFVAGSFYNEKHPPPVDDPMLDHCLYDDGSIKEFNATTGSERWDLKGGANLKTAQAIVIEVTGGDVTIKSSANINIEAPTQIYLKGPMKFEGDIQHIGNMTTSGTHTDSVGHHTATARDAELMQRIEALEARVAALEARHGN
jgi:phage baseplate assembly protein V